MTFVQAESVQEQGGGNVTPDSGNDPIIVDDYTDTYYDISFKDLTSVDWNNVNLNMIRRKNYSIVLANSQSVMSAITFTKNEDNTIDYDVTFIPNFEEQYRYKYSTYSNGWIYDTEGEENSVEVDKSQIPSLNGYRFLTETEINDLFGEDGPDYLMTDDIKNFLFNITPAS